MSTEQFTPGPWFTDTDSNGRHTDIRAVGDGDRIVVASVDLHSYRLACNVLEDKETGKLLDKWEKANANLIAAAPDMYEALRYTESILHSLIEQFGWDHKNLVNVAHAKCIAAISKANPQK